MLLHLFKNCVFTNGCFYLLHPGHVQLFKEIKTIFPNYPLVVGINSQKSIMINKPERKKELFSDEDRKFMIESIKYVDYAFLFDEETPIELIKSLRPKIIVKGSDYLEKSIVGHDLVDAVVLINFSKNYSTKNILMSNNSVD